MLPGAGNRRGNAGRGAMSPITMCWAVLVCTSVSFVLVLMLWASPPLQTATYSVAASMPVSAGGGSREVDLPKPEQQPGFEWEENTAEAARLRSSEYESELAERLAREAEARLQELADIRREESQEAARYRSAAGPAAADHYDTDDDDDDEGDDDSAEDDAAYDDETPPWKKPGAFSDIFERIMGVGVGSKAGGGGGGKAIDDVDDAENRKRREAVVEAFRHAWKGYRTYAWGDDELHPLRKSGSNWLGHFPLGLTIVDSLDTMYLMGLHDEVAEGKAWLKEHWKLDKLRAAGGGHVSTFETTIRFLGGFLSMYKLSGDRYYLDMADELGAVLVRAFDASRSGLPGASVDLGTGAANFFGWTGGRAILSEAGTLQLEFVTLARETGKQVYADRAMHALAVLATAPGKRDGLSPVYVNADTGTYDSGATVTLGALGDSYYEYLLKTWVLSGGLVPELRRAYDDAIAAVTKHLVRESSPSRLTFIGELHGGGQLSGKMDHLVCFAGGMYALGAQPMGDWQPSAAEAKEYMRIGAGITAACHETYARTGTGIAAEINTFSETGPADFESGPGAVHYLLRPETVESYFVLWRLTGDKKYRDWGWEAVQALNRHCRVDNGYSGIRDVRSADGIMHDDHQQSFFLAETLKYLYLLFAPRSLVPLDRWVFNTEAHPLPIFDAADVAKWRPLFSSFVDRFNKA